MNGVATLFVLAAWCLLHVSAGGSPIDYPLYTRKNAIQEWKRRGVPEKVELYQSENNPVDSYLLKTPPGIRSNDDDAAKVEQNVKYFMFSRDNPPPGVRFSRDIQQITATGFNSSRPTKVIAHGFANNITSQIFREIVPNLLSVGDFNVIGQDWGILASEPYYLTARLYVHPVASDLAQTLDFLADNFGLKADDLHIMGHSLGAHIAGTSSREMKAGPAARVTAMDPARPLFPKNVPDRLSRADATLVDVIHTTAGSLGIEEPLGVVDFYPNKGTGPQPGCGIDTDGACSHIRSFLFLSESILDEQSFPATFCDSTSAATNGRCPGGEGRPTAHMGYNLRFDKPGQYYLETASSSPFDLSHHSGSQGSKR